MNTEDIQIAENKCSDRPKYIQVRDALEQWISRNQLPPGTKLPSYRQLASHLQLTAVTVSKGVKELTKKGILRHKVGSGTYIINSKYKKHLRIGIICHETIMEDECYVSNVLKCFREYWHKIKFDTVSLIRTPDDYRKAIEEYALSGIMVLTPQPEFIPRIIELKDAGFPIVTIGAAMPELDGISFGTEHEKVCFDAVKYLTGLGHKRIGIFLSNDPDISLLERERGYYRGMWESQLPVNPDWIIRKKSFTDNLPAMETRRILHSKECPTAFLIAAYRDIIPVYTELQSQGLKIPEDVSLIGFDDPQYAQHLSPALTVFAQKIELFTTNAAEQLNRLINNQPLEKYGYGEAVLIERQSCVKVQDKTSKLF